MSGASDIPLGNDDPQIDDGDTQAGNTASSRSSAVFIEKVSEAIASAQMGRKLLLVYIAGDDEDSRKLDQITWYDSKVVSVLSQQCVALHLSHNSIDAAYFKAMYPYNEIPTIAIISHTGLLLKQLGGYVAPSEFLASIEQAAAKFYLQNAVMTVATLASDGADLSTSNNMLEGHSEADKLPSSVEATESERGCSSVPCDNIDISEQTHATSRPFSPPSDEITQESSVASQVSEALERDCSARDGFLDGLDTNEPSSPRQPLLGRKTYKSGSILLQIRLTNGENIRKDFNIEESLAVVRDFVDIHRTDGNTKYSLAVSYPRKTFRNEDMDKSLLELNLQDRATLILVTNGGKETGIEPSVTHASISEPNGAGLGIFWKLLSYLNPFAYFSSHSADINESPSGTSSWQYGPDPMLAQSMKTSLSQSRGEQQTLLGSSSSGSNVAQGEIRNRRSNIPQDRGWGGNIHTLPHDDDSGTFKNRNAFWNGNSTQYGGDDSKKN